MPRINWTESEVNHLIAHYPVRNAEQLANDLSRSYISVHNRIRLLKSQGKIVYLHQTKPALDETYGESTVTFIKINYPVYGSRYCMDKLNVPLRTVRTVASTLGLKQTEKTGFSINAHRFDESVLQAPIKEFAYFLGFFWGDGFMRESGTCVCVECVQKDLITIAPIFHSFAEWQHTDRPANTGSDGVARQSSLSLSLCNHALSTFLTEKGYYDKKHKAPDEVLAWLPTELSSYWWRGFFDADGSVTFKTNGIYSAVCSMSFASNHDQDWGFMTRLFGDLGVKRGACNRHHDVKRGHEGSAAVITNIEDCYRILSFLYRNYDYLGLARKYLPFLAMDRYLRFKQDNPYLYKESNQITPGLLEEMAK